MSDVFVSYKAEDRAAFARWSTRWRPTACRSGGMRISAAATNGAKPSPAISTMRAASSSSGASARSGPKGASFATKPRARCGATPICRCGSTRSSRRLASAKPRRCRSRLEGQPLRSALCGGLRDARPLDDRAGAASHDHAPCRAGHQPPRRADRRRGRARRGGVGGWLLLKPDAAKANSIAVLPFANLSGDPAQAYFSDGMAEELRSALSRIAGLKVVARTSSEMLRDSDAKTAAQQARRRAYCLGQCPAVAVDDPGQRAIDRRRRRDRTLVGELRPAGRGRAGNPDQHRGECRPGAQRRAGRQ